MQLLSFFTTLATFKVAAALPSAVKGANDLVTRYDSTSTFGSKVCVDVNFGGYCQTFSSAAGLTRGMCVRLDDSIRGLVSSIQPLEKSFCRYYVTENCQDPTGDGCGLYDAYFPGFADLKTVVPSAFLDLKKCEPGNMDNKIRSFICYRHLT
ncbi:hypothetical protein B0H65DRAFT_441995 [Neurospora tetraspora]|uniref:Uncharacterized protein n=1 Tax=Neurospora tetraspora TaxID=94610 RepID=A0AAE0MU19_9PEZI|nr:hypothetical protein B0H65DRAFT_441995 [Neurospora tetraspora]